ncbi:uncharacterized protein BP5553_04373 [Venustampulla echinocandica]|uniref:Sphingoid long-chain base transporter RSB1 n=1 Tax=Venustampulla echinocandica TaxID=2656787 RepID=A0A370TN29_9HELO|nr:uncharacterized protein BP5553_04373 [Venustampulla echinocandica]RDL36940.1 hypothetical protein BP5553_04373 [Venustampulla echinocandica]
MFISYDFVALALQAVGGAIADTNLSNQQMQDKGVHTMVAGLAFQVASLFLFSVLCIEYAWRVSRSQGTTKPTEYSYLTRNIYFRMFLGAIASATLFIVIRLVYRLIELQNGFTSKIANNEIMLMVFDGAMVVLACLSLTVFHPGLTLEGSWNFRPSKVAHDLETLQSINGIIEEMGVVTNEQVKLGVRGEIDGA